MNSNHPLLAQRNGESSDDQNVLFLVSTKKFLRNKGSIQIKESDIKSISLSSDKENTLEISSFVCDLIEIVEPLNIFEVE